MIDQESMAAMERMRQEDPNIRDINPLCPGRFAIRFEDGSAMLVDINGDIIKSPLEKYDVISRIEYIGTMEGKPHFAFEGRDWANRKMSETGIFDSDGHRKLFRDPRAAGVEGVEYLKWEFERLEKLSKDPMNPRQNDPFLIDVDSPHPTRGVKL